MGNTNSGESKPTNSVEQNQNIMVNQPSKVWKHAVNGDTEELYLKPKPTHAAFESTSENIFTQSEPLESKPLTMNGGLSETSVMQNYTESNANQPYYKEYMKAKTQYLNSKKMNGGLSETSVMENYTESNVNQPYYKQYMDIKRKYLNTKNMNGGYIFNKISSLLKDTEEMEVPRISNLSIDSKLNQIRSLLQDSETNQNSNTLVGSQQLRDLLLQDTETFMNFRGGNTKKEKMKHIKETTEEESETHEKKESEAHEKKESEAHEKEESEAKEKEESEAEEEKEESEPEPEEKEESDSAQSGGEELDTELKVILKELQINNKNSHKGGKSSRKSSKKSKKSSKKQSKRTTEESAMTNGTYDVDSESDNDNDYLTSSTESMNTSDINIGHYRE
jgi:hypothetical protein